MTPGKAPGYSTESSYGPPLPAAAINTVPVLTTAAMAEAINSEGLSAPNPMSIILFLSLRAAEIALATSSGKQTPLSAHTLYTRTETSDAWLTSMPATCVPWPLRSTQVSADGRDRVKSLQP